MIDIDLIQQCADPRLEIAVVQQFVAEISAPDHLAIRVFQGDKMILVPAPKSAEQVVKTTRQWVGKANVRVGLTQFPAGLGATDPSEIGLELFDTCENLRLGTELFGKVFRIVGDRERGGDDASEFQTAVQAYFTGWLRENMFSIRKTWSQTHTSKSIPAQGSYRDRTLMQSVSSVRRLQGGPVESPLIWESSRFAVNPRIFEAKDRAEANHTVNRTTVELLCGMVETAQQAGIEHIVSIFDARMPVPGIIDRFEQLGTEYSQDDDLFRPVRHVGHRRLGAARYTLTRSPKFSPMLHCRYGQQPDNRCRIRSNQIRRLVPVGMPPFRPCRNWHDPILACHICAGLGGALLCDGSDEDPSGSLYQHRYPAPAPSSPA